MVKNTVIFIKERKIRTMPRRGECIYKRKDGRWEARYVKEVCVDGTKKYGSVYADSYKAVKEKRECYINKLEKSESAYETITVSNITLKWICYIKNKVKPSTYQKYEGLCRNHIISHIGNIPLNKISRSEVEKFANKCLHEGKVNGGSMSSKSVNDILIILGLIFDFANEEYNINIPKISLLREEKKEARVLSILEQKKLTAYLTTDIDIYKFGVFFALYTGMRIGELCALKWDDVKENHVIVNKTMQRLRSNFGKTKIMIDTPKSQSSNRIIPLAEFLLPYVKQFRKPHGYVISTNRCEHSEPRLMQQKFKKITDECCFDNVTFHTLRHTFATRCIEAGFDVKTLSEILGHSDVKTTLNRYVHSSFELKQNNMAKLSI